MSNTNLSILGILREHNTINISCDSEGNTSLTSEYENNFLYLERNSYITKTVEKKTDDYFIVSFIMTNSGKEYYKTLRDFSDL